MVNNKINDTCPDIKIRFQNLETNALIDTGAIVSCINKKWFEDYKDQIGEYESFPLININLITATGQPSKKLKEIVLVTAEIGIVKFTQQYIIVPHLVKNVILGIDTLKLLNAKIDIRNNWITIDTDITIKNHAEFDF